jgi:hypothetical protein
VVLLAVVVALLLGCTIKTKDKEPDVGGQVTADGGVPQGDGGFVSHRPSGIGTAQPAADAGDAAPAPIVEPPQGPPADGSRDAARAIQEADIIQLSGTKLYAMSKIGGLSVIDVSVRDTLKILGRYRAEAVPFEMYIRGNTLFGLFNDEANGHVVALDVSNPAAIRALGTFDLPGQVNDSRIVGQILYAVAYDTSASPAKTTILSLGIADPAAVAEVARQQFQEKQGTWGWSKTSVTVTDQRMYVAAQSNDNASTIQVVDISDPGGALTLGASLAVNGEIVSRWQMDEYMNVFRVVSQASDYTGNPPVIQTWSIASSSAFTPLATAAMSMPTENEYLSSVRYDGTRCYVVTRDPKDPLFIVDLTDPAKPVQAGQLVMPGYLYHMEPRGTRLLGLGIDSENQQGSLNVSIFDVTDMNAPALLQRVNFGAKYQWQQSQLVEDQNRIHKLFNVIDDLGLILVPYAGTTDATTCGYASGIQIIDWNTTANTLTLQGVAPAKGTARRAFLYDERLFSVSDQAVQTFDIADHAKPVQKAQLPLVNRVHRTVPVGDRVLRIQSDYDTHVGLADVQPLANVTTAETAGYLDLSAVVYGAENANTCEYHDDDPFRKLPVFAFGNYAVLPIEHKLPVYGNTITDVLVIDASPAVPTVAATLRVDSGLVPADLGRNAVQVGNLLVLERPGTNVVGDQQSTILAIVDLTDPLHPALAKSLERPVAWGTTGLFTKGSQVQCGYYAANTDGSVSYFLDRIDAASAAGAAAQSPVNIPGLLVGPAGEQVVTVDFDWVERPGFSSQWDCENVGGVWDSGTCWTVTRTFKLVGLTGASASTVGSSQLADNVQLTGVQQGTSTFFFSATLSYEPVMLVLGAQNGTLTSQTVQLAEVPVSPQAAGTKLYFIQGSALSVLDATTATAALSKVGDLSTSTGMHLSITGQTAIVSLGDSGVQTLTIP